MTITGTRQLGPNTGMHQAASPSDMSAAEAVARDALSREPGWGRLKRHELWRLLDFNGMTYDARTATSNDMVKMLEAEQLRGVTIKIPPEWGAADDVGGTPSPAASAAPRPDPRVDHLSARMDVLTSQLEGMMNVLGKLVEAPDETKESEPEPVLITAIDAIADMTRRELWAQAKLRGLKFRPSTTAEEMREKILKHDNPPVPYDSTLSSEDGQDAP